MNYDDAYEYLILNEGRVFTNKPNDKGGPTKFGITIPFLTDYLGRQATIADIVALDDTLAKAVYKKMLWDALYCDKLLYSIACALFDTSADKTKHWTVAVAQMLVKVKADGIMGEETINALNSTDPEIFIYNFIGALQHSYTEICLHSSSQLEFLDGWLKRALRLFLLVGK